MAAGTPLNRLVLVARSVADDLGYAALADVARALEGVTGDYRIIGGVNEQVRGQFRGHGAQAQCPLRLFDGPNVRGLLPSSPRNQRRELVVGLGEIDHVSLTLRQRRHWGVQLVLPL